VSWEDRRHTVILRNRVADCIGVKESGPSTRSVASRRPDGRQQVTTNHARNIRGPPPSRRLWFEPQSRRNEAVSMAQSADRGIRDEKWMTQPPTPCMAFLAAGRRVRQLVRLLESRELNGSAIGSRTLDLWDRERYCAVQRCTHSTFHTQGPEAVSELGQSSAGVQVS